MPLDLEWGQYRSPLQGPTDQTRQPAGLLVHTLRLVGCSWSHAEEAQAALKGPA